MRAFHFDAEDYSDIITWRDCEITEPPLTLNMFDEALKAIVNSGLTTCHNNKHFPCHTLAVEYCIKFEWSEVKKMNERGARLLSRQ